MQGLLWEIKAPLSHGGVFSCRGLISCRPNPLFMQTKSSSHADQILSVFERSFFMQTKSCPSFKGLMHTKSSSHADQVLFSCRPDPVCLSKKRTKSSSQILDVFQRSLLMQTKSVCLSKVSSHAGQILFLSRPNPGCVSKVSFHADQPASWLSEVSSCVDQILAVFQRSLLVQTSQLAGFQRSLHV